MYNIHLERDHKTDNFKAMELVRREKTNEIIAIDGSTKHFYSFKSRKQMNSDWKDIHKTKTIKQ